MKIHQVLTKSDLAARNARGETDGEIAAAVGVGCSTITHWRHVWGIPRADPFRRRFEQTYGPGAVRRFTTQVRAGWSLRRQAEAFGFSREYARQVRRKLGV